MVTTVASPQGRVEHTGLEAVLRGTVVDSTRGGKPLAGAALWLGGTPRLKADEAGRFEIRGPFDGEYGVSFWHPRLDSLGISADEQRVTLTRGSAQRLTLFVPPESVVVRRFCPHGLAPGKHVIVGLVRDSTAAPVPRARVEVRLVGSKSRETGNVNEDGRYIICNVPPGAVIVSAEGRGASGDVLIEFRENQVWVEGKPAAGATGQVWRQDILVKPPE
jgi:hypothetical protein